MNPSSKYIHFSTADETAFHQALLQASQDYLQKNNDHRLANKRNIVVAGGLFLLSIASYFYALSTQSSAVYIMAYSFFVILIMFLNVICQHDACHNTLFKNTRINRIVGRLVTLPLGIDPDFWRVRHVDYHHHYANIEHYDLDIEENGIFRQTPFQQWRGFMRYQHIYWPLIAALSLSWVALVFDWADRTGRTRLRENNVLSGWQGWLLFLLSKLLHLTVMIGLPLAIAHTHGISISTILFTYLVSQMMASMLVVYLLLGTHWAETKFFTPPANHQMPHGWYQHNFMTACDWLPSPHWLWRLTGGVNYHLTHHLFPGWHHRHYPALAQIIARLANEYKMPYRCISYRQLVKSQISFLRRMGTNNMNKID